MAAYSKSVPALCGISAALVHYFMLVYFMWTAAEAVFLFIKLVKVLGNKINHFTLKAGLLSWRECNYIFTSNHGILTLRSTFQWFP